MAATLITRVLWAALGVFIAIEARDLGMGSLDEPGAGLLAFGLGVVMAATAMADAVRALLRRRSDSAGAAPWRFPLRQFAVTAALLIYVALLEPLGFVLSTLFFLLTLFLAPGRQSWPRALAFAVLGSGVSYALFKYALGVQLPAGLLG